MIQPLAIGIVVGNRRLAEEVRGAMESLPVNVLFRQWDLPDMPSFLELVERFHPDVLILELAALPRPFEVHLRRIRQTAVAPLIIALSDSADPDTILAAVRGGASEYVFPPLQDSLEKALERMSEERARTSSTGRVGGRTLGFLSSKGGCGATTVACHIAAALQRTTGGEVLLADFDLDSGMVAFLMKSHGPYSAVDAASNTHRLDVSYWKALVSNAAPKLDVIGAPPLFVRRSDIPQQEYRKVLRFVRSAYDWTVVDLGRSLETLSVGLVTELDEAFLIANVDLPALHQTKQIVQVLLDCGYERARIHLVLNRVPRKPDIGIAEVERLLSLPVYAALPDDYAEMHEALAQGELVSPGCELGKQFESIARKIAGAPRDGAPKPAPASAAN